MAKPKIQPKIERGMRDFLPEVMRRRNWCMQQLREVFESFGFEPLDTPAVESLAVLMGKYGEEGDRLIFKLAKGDGNESALRYDLTVPLARVVAMHQNEIALPWKRYHIAPVWRAERPQRGRFREFLQCDIDTVGAPAPVADAEVVSVAAAAYRALGFGDVVLRLNHRGLVTALCQTAGVDPDSPAAGFLLRIIDKEDRLGVDGVCDTLAAGEAKEGRDPISVEAGVVSLVRDLLATRESDDIPTAMEGLLGAAAAAPQAFAELRAVVRALQESGAAPGAKVDPGLMRGLDYYTGPIFEAVVPDGGIGSVGGGGRYDGLIGTMLGRDIPAVGFSVGLERLLVVLALREAAKQDRTQGASDVLVATFNDDLVGDAMALAGKIRAVGLRAEVFPGPPGKLKKQYTYADKRGIRLVALVGPDEAAIEVVQLKDLREGSEERMPREDVPQRCFDVIEKFDTR